MTERIVAASPGGWDAPSAQRRLGAFSRDGTWPVDMFSAGSFPTEVQLNDIAAAAGSGTTLILQRVLPAPSQLAQLRAAYDRIIFDMDDALYAVPPDVEGSRLAQAARAIGRTAMRGYPRASARRRPLIRTLRAVDACVAGNAILAAFARRHCPRVIEIPTTVSPIQEVPRRTGNPSVVWVGVAANLQYLGLIADPLRQLREEIEFEFTVVSSQPWVTATVPTEFVRWSRAAELDALLGARIGVAPLTDDPWARGKCGFRAILYGGHALPTVASPVGITDQVVIEGDTGVHASTNDQWVDALRRLLTDPDQAVAMGTRAWQRIRARYSDQVALRMWQELLSD